MMDEDHNAQLIKEAFGDKTVYEILEIPKEADEDAIKKAYRKLALKYHPDKGGDAKLFQALSLAHSILADPEKRKLYDQTGDCDGSSQDFAFWYEYFRNLFPAISVSDIDKFSEKYIGSKEEEDDVAAAYQKHDGDLKKIMESVILAEDGDESRICQIIDTAIENGDLSSTKKYKSTRVSAAAANKKRKKPTKSSDASLEQLILARNKKGSSTSSAMGNIFEKYGGGKASKDDSYEISDEEFAKMQKKITKKPPTKK